MSDAFHEAEGLKPAVTPSDIIGPDFIVRGHHASNLYFVLGAARSISEVMRSARRHTVRNYSDVFGDTAEELELAEAGIREFYETFVNLPDESTVLFVSGQKDGLCKSCIHGEHCLKNQSDNPSIRAMARMAARLGFEGQVIETRVSIENKRGRVVKRPNVAMPAWLARQIIGDEGFHAETTPWFLRGLVRRDNKQRIATRKAAS